MEKDKKDKKNKPDKKKLKKEELKKVSGGKSLSSTDLDNYKKTVI